jgi:hypothetical protein
VAVLGALASCGWALDVLAMTRVEAARSADAEIAVNER